MKSRPLVLIILDGWGYSADTRGNAIAMARKPVYDQLLREFPSTLIHTSGPYVGLPEGQMGNSEVGHLNIGAGRVVHMDVTRIDRAILDGSFFSHPVLVNAMRHAAREERRLHLFGLLSDGGVHSQQEHLHALLRMAKQNEITRCFVHCFMDGRDTLPTSGAGYVEKLLQQMAATGVGKVASVSGRFYAMDRDLRWEREQKTFKVMVAGKSEGGYWADPVAGIKNSYEHGIGDEFIVPFVCTQKEEQPVAKIEDDDVCISFNFRADRSRQITRCIARNSGLTAEDGRDLPDAAGLDAAIPRHRAPKNLKYVCMTQYDKKFTLPFVVTSESLTHILANVMGDAGLRNLRVAETEKYAHVTYFFNGGVENPFPGEDRVLVPSEKVTTYDMRPAMSAEPIAAAVVKAVDDSAFDVVIVNFANADMVGHSGQIPATIEAVEVVDRCLGMIYRAVRQRGGTMLVTADHGNAEMMIDPVSGGPHTAHTTNPVPLLFISPDADRFKLRAGGALQDLSPTVLGLIGISLPAEMTGTDLRLVIGRDS